MAEPRDGAPPQETAQDAFGEHLGRAIRVIRAGQDLSRKELAERSGLSYSYIAEIENGAKTPSSKALVALAEALGVAVHELLGAAERWERTPPPHSFEELRQMTRPPARSSADDVGAFLDEARGPAPPARLRSASQRRSLFRRLVGAPPSEAGETRDPPSAERVLGGSGGVDAALDTLTASQGGLDDAAELLRLLAALGPEDRERVLDLARRLSDE